MSDINKTDEDGNTLLMLSIILGRLKVAQKLLDAGANKDAKNNNGYTALHFAEKYNLAEVKQALLKARPI